MRVLTIGCSNSSTIVGKPWCDFVEAAYPQHSFRKACSPGAGNEFNLEKMKLILKEEDFDCVIVQLSEPSRLTMALGETRITADLNTTTNAMGGLLYYTFNVIDNVGNLQRMGYNYTREFDQFFNALMFNEYNMEAKTLSTMLAMDALCKSRDIKIVFWSWFVDIKQVISNQGMGRFFANSVILDGVADHILVKHFKPEPCGHFNSVAHEHLAKGWIIPNLKNKKILE